MKQALMVIDVQEGILQKQDFKEEQQKITHIMKDFQKADQRIFAFQHIDSEPNSPLYENGRGIDLNPAVVSYADFIIRKKTPSIFFQTDLEVILKDLEIDHLFIVGFNTEFCCQFSAIAAFDRGYKVTFIEDATGTVNTDLTYEVPGFDIRDFVGTVLHWSNVIEVLDYQEYIDLYKNHMAKPH